MNLFKKRVVALTFAFAMTHCVVWAGDPSGKALPSLTMTEFSRPDFSESQIIFHYQAFNIGSVEASGVIMSSQPGNGFIYVSHVCPSGWSSQTYRSDDGHVVAACENGNLAAGADARMEIALKSSIECMGTPYAPLINRTSVYSRHVEWDYTDNEVESRFYPIACPSSSK